MEPFVSGVIIIFVGLLLLFTVGNYIMGYFGVSGGLGDTLGIPAETAAWPNALWFIVMPMMATLAIIYGFMEELRIFRRSPNATTIYTVIGIAWSGMLMYSGALKILAIFFYQLGAMVAAVAFSLLFIFGTVVWSLFRGKGMVGEFREQYGPLKGEKSPIDANFSRMRVDLKRLQFLNGLKTATQNESDEFNIKKSEFASAYDQLSVQLVNALTGGQKKELEKMKNEFDKLKETLITA